MTNFNIKAPNLSIEKSLIEKINNLNKPKGSLGRLEEIASQIGLILCIILATYFLVETMVLSVKTCRYLQEM